MRSARDMSMPLNIGRVTKKRPVDGGVAWQAWHVRVSSRVSRLCVMRLLPRLSTVSTSTEQPAFSARPTIAVVTFQSLVG